MITHSVSQYNLNTDERDVKHQIIIVLIIVVILNITINSLGW